MERWCAKRKQARGEVMPAAQCYELARRWYSGRLERDFERPTVREMEATFRAVGLTGEFWRLEG